MLNFHAGVPQGLILGPAQWNIFYKGILKFNFLTSVEVVGYTDDLAIIAWALTTDEVETAITTALGQIQGWMDSNGLGLVPQKTELVLLSGRREQDT